jgi:hypothetical protein
MHFGYKYKEERVAKEYDIDKLTMTNFGGKVSSVEDGSPIGSVQ